MDRGSQVESRGKSRVCWALRLVPVCAAAVCVPAFIQFKYLFHLDPVAWHFTMPILVGGTFGYLLGRVLDLRSEVKALATELEQHLEEKEHSLSITQAKLVEAQRMSSLGDMAARVAHDFNNVLTAIMSGAMLAQDRTSDPEGAQLLDDVIDSIESGAVLTRQVLSYGKDAQQESDNAELDTVVKRTCNMLRLLLPKGQSLSCELDTVGVSVCIGAGQLQQLLMNLVVNARDAMGEEGEIRIRSGLRSLGEPPVEMACIQVEDTGPGIPEEILEKITEPFFTTKEEGKGTGLGLSVVSEIVDSCGGHLEIKSREGEGTTVLVDLPALRKVSSAAS